MIKAATRRHVLKLFGLASASLPWSLGCSLAGRSISEAGATLDCAEKGRYRRYESDVATFQPWVGENYEAAPFGCRTLILGEANFDWKGGEVTQCRNVTRDLVADLTAEPSDDGRLRHSSWIYFAMMFLNSWPYSLEERRFFWDGIAFYNYLQSTAGFRSDGAPTPAHWKDSEAAFFDVVRLLKPQVMSVLGDRLWNNLPLQRRVWAADGIPFFVYKYPGGSCLAVPNRQRCARVHRTSR